jgi:hypothetical protein
MNINILFSMNYFLIIITILVVGYSLYYIWNMTNTELYESFIPCKYQNNPLYSQSVDLGILADTYTCSNFCGPHSTCAITKEQCTSNNDCYGCKPPCEPNTINEPQVNPEPSEFSGNGGLLNYSSLTSDLGTISSPASTNSLNNTVSYPYQGPYEGSWIQTSNAGTELYNERLEHEYMNNPASLYQYTPLYPTTISATGAYYDTLPSVNL